MPEDDAEAAVRSALGTEHFVLQSAASSTVSESGSRAALYFSALSGALVAIGFGSASPAVLPVLVCTVLPTLTVLGLFTTVRLVDTAIENIDALRRIDRIHDYYASLDPTRAAYFAPRPFEARGRLGGRRGIFYTAASMVVTVNAVVTGATVASILVVVGASQPLAVAAGVLAGAAALAAGFGYQARRLGAFLSERLPRTT